VLARKRWIAERYTERLSRVSGVRVPVERGYAVNVFWMYGVVIEPDRRDDVMASLASYGIESRTMFCPMNLQPALLKLGAVDTTPCPVAEHLFTHGMYLPSGCLLTESDISRVCDAIERAL